MHHSVAQRGTVMRDVTTNANRSDGTHRKPAEANARVPRKHWRETGEPKTREIACNTQEVRVRQARAGADGPVVNVHLSMGSCKEKSPSEASGPLPLCHTEDHTTFAGNNTLSKKKPTTTHDRRRAKLCSLRLGLLALREASNEQHNS